MIGRCQIDLGARRKLSTMARPKIGLALGSGSARGWSHIGVIEALAEAGFAPDVVCGTSMGAFVGAVHVAGKLGDLRQWAEAVNWREIVRFLDLRLLKGGLIDGKEIVGFLRRHGVAGPIEDYATPFAAIATELATGKEMCMTSGPIEQAVRASIALPGIFSPARVDHSWLVDGGLVNPVPVSACRALGADIVIAVNLNGDRVGRRGGVIGPADRAGGARTLRRALLERFEAQMPPALKRQVGQIAPKILPASPARPGYFDVLANSIYIMQDQITQARLAVEKPAVTLNPRLGAIGLLEFNRAGEAIAEGRACVARALKEIRTAAG
jgi:NTE family protein